MSSAGNTKNNGQASTYVIDGKKKAELHRLVLQDHMVTRGMGGVLPEQGDTTRFEHILDIGCGPGGWILQVAQISPKAHLVGVDINAPMLKYAREQAETTGLAERVTFREMDVLHGLDFPEHSFDLVNLRFGTSYVRKWDWPNLVFEMQRVSRPGGVIRITESEIVLQSSSSALTQLCTSSMQALYRAGNFFTNETTGLTDHLAGLLTRGRCEDVQSRAFSLQFQAGTPEGQLFVENTKNGYQAVYPFIQKWTNISKTEYNALYRQACKEMDQPNFRASWHFVTVWGKKSL